MKKRHLTLAMSALVLVAACSGGGDSTTTAAPSTTAPADSTTAGEAGDGTITADALAEILEQDDGLPQSPDEVRRLRAELVRNLAKHEGDTDLVARAMGRDQYQIHRWLERFALHPESYRL